MFYKPQDFLTPLHAFVQEYVEALQNTAFLLGGRPYLLLVRHLIADLQMDPVVTRRVRANALTLHSLLNLEHVLNFNRPEAAFFSKVDSALPIVEEICLLIDGYTHALRSSNALHDEEDYPLNTVSEADGHNDRARAWAT